MNQPTPTLIRRAFSSGRPFLAALLAFTIVIPAGAQADPQARGLRPPSKEEGEWMNRNLKVTAKVRLNPLGLRRLNAYRAQRGLPAVATTAATAVGQESLTASAAATDVTIAALPGAVDNSTLDAFPPVRSQGDIGSCASFSTTYYVATHMTGLARGWNNRSADNARKLSPRWTYNFVNDGSDNGSWFSSTMDVLLKMGGATWGELPYDGNAANPLNYLAWSLDESVWRNAINHRFAEAGRVQDIDTTTGIENVKSLLNNGYLLLYATDIYGWQFTQFSNDPATTADDPLVGRRVCGVVKTSSSGHAMTIVGYNDNVWTDLNKNGAVDAGEKGALKIVNSWGNNWGVPGTTSVTTDGFAWIAYDALKPVSAVAGADNLNRATGYRGAFWGREVYWITARSAYTPSLLGRLTITHPRRSQLWIKVGASTTSTTTPAAYFPVATTFDWQNSTGWPQVFRNFGGAFGLDGQTGSTTAGTFVFDLTDLVQSGPRRYYLEVVDNAVGNPAGVSAFSLITPGGATLATAAAGLPLTADNTTARVQIDFSPGAIPSMTSPVSTAGVVGQPFAFTLAASNAPNAFAAAGLPPGLVIDPASGQITGTPTLAGVSTVSASASNASGTGSAALAITISATPANPPDITSPATANGVVGQAFTYPIAASNSPTTFSATSLPAGLDVNPATGTITGMPSLAGTFTATLGATNAGGTGTRGLTITIAPAAGSVPFITSPGAASGASGSAFTYRIEATNSPTSFAAIDLPSGLSLDVATGDITGTLPVARSYDVTLSAANSTGTGYKILALTVTGDSSFGPANDAFGNRNALTGQTAATAGSSVNATAETSEPPHAAQPASRSVWWSWTAPVAGLVTIRTAGSTFDTRLAVYTGTSVGSLALVTANDDATNGTTTSLVTFNAAANTSYEIAVDGSEATSGNIALELVQTGAGTPPVNDDFTNRAALTGSNPAIAGGNVHATGQGGEPAHAGNSASRSVWWTWTAPSAGTVMLDTIGSNFDTVLAVYTGSAVGALTQVAADDESGGGNTSRATFTVTPGATYQIAVDGYLGATGSVALRLALNTGTAPDNDAFANALPLAGATLSTSGANGNATAEPTEPSHAGYLPRKSIWWKWTAPGTGTLTVDTKGSTFDTTLAVYNGSSVGSLTPIASDDDTGGNRTSEVTTFVFSGVTYRIAVDGYEGAAGAVALQLAFAPDTTTNDSFANRAVLGTLAGASNVSASAEPAEPDHAASIAEKSLWWKWTAPDSGTVKISTATSAIDTVLAVYTGSTLANLSVVAENDDASANTLTSEVSFFASEGVEYQVAVDGFDGAAGQIALAVNPEGGTDLYFTDFETFTPGFDTIGGTDGWAVNGPPDIGATGIFDGFEGSGRSGWIGFSSSTEDVIAWRPVNYVPPSPDKAFVRFSVDFAVFDSTTGSRDLFALTLFNTSGQSLGAVSFDNATLAIDRSDGVVTRDTGKSFLRGVKYALTIDIDLASNLWTAALDGVPIFSRQPITARSPLPQLSFGDLDLVLLAGGSGSGDNYLVFDDYRVTLTTGLPPDGPPVDPPAVTFAPVLSFAKLAPTAKPSAVVRGKAITLGSPVASARYRLKGGKWKPLRLVGGGTILAFNARVTGLLPGRNVVSFELTDAEGRVSRRKVTILRE